MESQDKNKSSESSKQRKKPRNIKKWVLILLSIGFLLFLIALIVLLAYPLERKDFRSETDSQTCAKGFFLAPALYRGTSKEFSFEFSEKFTVADWFDLLAREVCFKPNVLLEEEYTYKPRLYLFDERFFPKNINITTTAYPELLRLETDLAVPIATTKILQFTIDKPNNYLSYKVLGGEAEAECEVEEVNVNCPLKSLQMGQGKEYEIQIASFNGEEIIEVLESKTVKTVAPLTVAWISFEDGQMVYDHGSSYSFSFNEKVSQPGTIKLESITVDGTRTEIPTSLEIKGDNITLKPNDRLNPNENFELTIADTVGESSAFLPDPYKITFKTASAPIVLGSNLRSAGVVPNSYIYIELDQAIKPGQDLKSLISFTTPKDFSVYSYGSVITIAPTGFEYCEQNTITVQAGVQNDYGSSTTQSYSYTFKTSCAAITTVGYSVGGKPINAFIFGNGSNTLLLHGSIHGSEGGTYSMLNTLIAELETRASEIPANKRVIVMPTINPDGLSRGDRLNNNGVDINRNFLTSNWQQETYLTGGMVFPNGGGSAPFSEPETQALRNAVLTWRPYMTVSFHAAGGYVISNGSGQSDVIASHYSGISGYSYVSAAGSGTVFDYSITGSFDDWAMDNGMSTILIETFGGGNEIGRNRDAIWWLISL